MIDISHFSEDHILKCLGSTPYFVYLDSSDLGSQNRDLSIMGMSPFLILKVEKGVITRIEGDHSFEIEGNPFEILQTEIEKYASRYKAIELPFSGGAIG